MKHSLIICALLSLCVFAVGCNSKIAVSGKVTFPDGSPLTVGKVVFEDQAGEFTYSGILKPDGSYTLGTLKETDGIPKGTYKVAVYGASEETAAGLKHFIDKKFRSTKNSGITCDVQRKTVFDFKVKPSDGRVIPRPK